MTYKELKKAYELALQKCSELEKKIFRIDNIRFSASLNIPSNAS